MLPNALPTPYDSKHDVSSYFLSKQERRRKKSKPIKERTTNEVNRYNKKTRDKKKNIKSMEMLNKRYVNNLKYDKNHYDSSCYIDMKRKIEKPKTNVAPFYDHKLSNNAKLGKHKHCKNKNIPKPIAEHLSIELLISGYCNNLRNAEGMNNAVLVQIIGLYLKASTNSHKTLRAIASANCIAEIINTFQHRHKCPFIENENDDIDLLQFVYVRGGALRDVVLSREINDIDIIINTCALTNVYWYHLIKYHNDISSQYIDCRCYLWQRYLNMYRITADVFHKNDENDAIKRFEKNIVGSEFVLNARFFKDIIMDSMYNKDDEMNAVNTWGYANWKLMIHKRLFYKWIDLCGANFDIGDELSNTEGMVNTVGVNVQYDVEWNDIFDRLRRERKNGTMNCVYGEYGRDRMYELFPVALPMYSFDMVYSTQYCDFTVNGLRLPLSVIFDTDHAIYDTDGWFSKILSYENDHNKVAMHDIEHKIIRQPDLNILRLDEVYDGYFWRFIKILSKFDYKLFLDGTWKADANTVQWIQNAYNAHFRSLTVKDMKKFIKRLLFWIIDDRLSNDKFEEIINARLMIFELIHFDNVLKNAFGSHSQFGKLLKDTIDRDNKLNSAKKRFLYRVLRKYSKNLKLEHTNVNGKMKRDTYTETAEGVETKKVPGTKIGRVATTKGDLMFRWYTRQHNLAAAIKPLMKIFTKKKMYKHYKFYDDDNIYKHNYYFNENNLKLSLMINTKWRNREKKSLKQRKAKKKLKKSKKNKSRQNLKVLKYYNMC